MKKLILILPIVLLSTVLCHAQIEFQRTVGGTNTEAAFSVVQSIDGGYAAAGYTYSFGAGNQDIYIVKLDGSGTLQWSKTYGGTGDDRAYSIIQTTDGGYAVAGHTNSFGAGGFDMYIVKLDGSGTLLWSKAIGGTSDEHAYSVIQTLDGGYVLAGSTTSFGAGSFDFYIVKLDGNGALQWSSSVGGADGDYARCIIQTTDGGYAVTGYTSSFGLVFSDVYILKLDGNGALQWSRTVGGSSIDYAWSIIQTVDGGYASAGSTYSFGAGGYDCYIVKLNSSGMLDWTRSFGGTSDDYANSIIQTSDGGYEIAGYTFSFGAMSSDSYIVKLDGNSLLQWSRTLGGTGGDDAYSIKSTADGGAVTAGETTSFGMGQTDLYIVKFDANGNTCGNTSSPTSISGNGGTLGTPSSVVTTPTSTVSSPASLTNTGGTLITICANCDLTNYSWLKAGTTGAELNLIVNALFPFNGKLIAGGTFTQASGNTVNRIASWDGSVWLPLGNGLTGGLPFSEVDALTVYQNKLIVAGRFSLAGSVTANNISQWDGSNWTSIGTGSANGTNDQVLSLTVHNNKLMVGGNFTTAGGITANGIAMWDGTNWSTLGSGVNGKVSSLLSFGANLIAGGVFNTAGSTTVNNIAKWDGSNWSSLGSGITLINGNVQGVGALANYNNNLIAAGRFNNAGGTPVNFIAKWNGSAWFDLGGGFPGSYEGIYTLFVSNNILYAGGLFTTAGTNNANSVAKWDGNTWRPLGNGIVNTTGPGVVHTLMSYNNPLYAGGEFTSPDYSWIAMSPCESTIPIGIESGNNLIPKNYYLHQNYPNPFNPNTKIRFNIPKASFTTVKIYNILGAEVITLLNKLLQPGVYEADWNAANYPSGVYFFKLTSGEFVETKKMVLIK